MTKKQLYIIIGIFIIITLGFFLALFVINQGEKTSNGTINTSTPFSPFGNSGDTTNTNGGEITDTTSNNSSTQSNNGNLPLLRQITPNPVAGFYATTKSGKTYSEYLEKETGNVYEMRLEDMQSNRLSGSLMPKITEAYFANKGKSVVVRYLKNNSDIISSFVLAVSNTKPSSVEVATSTDQLLPNGKFLPTGIIDIKISNDERTAFYLTRSDTFNERMSFGSIFNFEKNTTSEVFQSPFSEWLPVSYDGNTVILQTKASQKVPGFLYSFGIKTGILQKIIGGISGLSVLPSPNGQYILYSESTKGGIALRVYEVKTNMVINLSIQTLPEKCVWKNDNVSLYCAVPDSIPSGEYPDIWYQGIVSFSDALWKIDTKTGKLSAVLDPSAFSQSSMDMTHLSLSPLEDFLFFTNKKNSSLWAFEIKRVNTLEEE